MLSSVGGYREVCLRVDAGPIGINLQSVRGGRGAFVESFYRAEDGQVYDAEGGGQICVGDRIAFIADNTVLTDSIDVIHSKLLQQRRPFVIWLRRSEWAFQVNDLVFDPRVKAWVNAYMEDYCTAADGYLLRRKADVYFLARLLCDFLSKYGVDGPDGESAGELRALCTECFQFCVDARTDEQQVITIRGVSNAECLSNALNYLRTDLSKALLLKFRQCSIARKLVGWMSDSPMFHMYTIVQILEQEELAVCYYLHLCTLGMARHRYLHLLLNKRQRLRPKGVCASPHKSKVHLILQRIALQAAKEGLLYSFYGSTIYELSLRERENSHLYTRTAHSGLVQRVLRAVSLPVGISLHRRGSPGAQFQSSLSPPADTEPGYVLLFDVSAHKSVHTTASAALVVEDGLLIARPAPPSVLAAPVLQFLVPCGSCRTTDSREQSPPESRLVNFTINMKGGISLYGASLVAYQRVVNTACSPCASAQSVNTAEVGDLQPSPPYMSQDLEASSAVAVESAEGDDLDDHVSGVVSAAVPSNSVADAISLPNQRPASQESLLNLVLARGQEGAVQSALVMAKVRNGAGDMFRGFKQWSEHAVLPTMHLPSLVLSAAPPPHDHPVSTTAQTIHRKTVSDDADRVAYVRQGRTGQAGECGCEYLAYGVSILTAEPKVDCLRHLLRLAARHILSTRAEGSGSVETDGDPQDPPSYESEQLKAILRSWSAAGDIVQDLRSPTLQQGVATDFNASAVFEALCPRNLVTLFIACLLEYRVVLVSSGHTVALLVGEWLKLAMLPLKWCHIYAPVAPEHVALQLLQCPAPYLLGIRHESLEASHSLPSPGVLLVDLDADTVSVPADLQVALPAAESLVHQLAAVLKPNLCGCDAIVQGDVHGVTGGKSDPLCIGGPAELCRQYLHTLLKPLDKCIVVLDDTADTTVVLDEELLVRKVCAAAASSTSAVAVESLIRHMMRAQSFSEHLLSEAANFNNSTK